MLFKKTKFPIYVLLALIFLSLPCAMFSASLGLNTDYIRVRVIRTNSNPVASISCCPDDCDHPSGGCTGYTDSTFCLRNDSTDPDGEGDIATSSWYVYPQGGSPGPTPDLKCSGKCNYTPQALGGGDYTVQLKIEDSQGAVSFDTEDFTIIQDADAEFECAYMIVGPWLPCDIFGVSAGTIVYFRDTSSPSELGTTIIRRDWYFEDGTPASDVDNNSTTTSSSFETVDGESGKVILQIEDDAGRINEQEYQVLLKRRTPQWYEVSP
jgi:hypothetical protein